MAARSDQLSRDQMPFPMIFRIPMVHSYWKSCPYFSPRVHKNWNSSQRASTLSLSLLWRSRTRLQISNAKGTKKSQRRPTSPIVLPKCKTRLLTLQNNKQVVVLKWMWALINCRHSLKCSTKHIFTISSMLLIQRWIWKPLWANKVRHSCSRHHRYQ